MKRFKQFLIENELSNKKAKALMRNPDGSQQIKYPGSSVIHHDKEKALTVYHMHEPEAAHAFGSGSKWCTATPKESFAHDYMNRGNLFVIHHKNERYQYFHNKEQGDYMDYHADDPPDHHYEAEWHANYSEFKNVHNQRPSSHYYIHDLVGPAAARKMHNTEHHEHEHEFEPPPNPHPYEEMPAHHLIDHIKNLPTNERFKHIRALHVPSNMGHTYSGRPTHGDEDYDRSTESVLRERGNHEISIHHFADDHDPDIRAHVAHYAPLDTVHHLRDDPHKHVRDIIHRRLQVAGNHVLKQHPEDKGIDRPDPKIARQFFLPFEKKKK